jgi:hypothetical protein
MCLLLWVHHARIVDQRKVSVIPGGRIGLIGDLTKTEADLENR